MAEPCIDCGAKTEYRGNPRLLHLVGGERAKPCDVDGAACGHWGFADDPMCHPCQDMMLHQSAFSLGLVVERTS